jgi:hypothetical protein
VEEMGDEVIPDNFYIVMSIRICTSIKDNLHFVTLYAPSAYTQEIQHEHGPVRHFFAPNWKKIFS